MQVRLGIFRVCDLGGLVCHSGLLERNSFILQLTLEIAPAGLTLKKLHRVGVGFAPLGPGLQPWESKMRIKGGFSPWDTLFDCVEGKTFGPSAAKAVGLTKRRVAHW